MQRQSVCFPNVRSPSLIPGTTCSFQDNSESALCSCGGGPGCSGWTWQCEVCLTTCMAQASLKVQIKEALKVAKWVFGVTHISAQNILLAFCSGILPGGPQGENNIPLIIISCLGDNMVPGLDQGSAVIKASTITLGSSLQDQGIWKYFTLCSGGPRLSSRHLH